MQIIENNSDRVILVDDNRIVAFIFLAFFFPIGCLVTAAAFTALYADAANFLAPGWAEAHGLSNLRWKTEDGQELPRAHSLIFSIGVMCFSLLVFVSGLFEILFRSSRRLIIEFDAQHAILFRQGLFRLPERSLPLSDLTASIWHGTNDETDQISTHLVIRIVKGRSTSTFRKRWQSFWPLWEADLSSTQVTQLQWLTCVLPAASHAATP